MKNYKQEDLSSYAATEELGKLERISRRREELERKYGTFLRMLDALLTQHNTACTVVIKKKKEGRG